MSIIPIIDWGFKKDEKKQKYCTSCGRPIPGCSMCYGDIDYGQDNYYREWAENQEIQRQQEDT